MTQSASKQTILVTGASGNIGGQVIDRLRDDDVVIRAGGRDLSRIERRHPRVSAVKFDYHDRATWNAALSGSDVVFVVAPASEGFSKVVIEFIDAARDEGVKHVVRYSAVGVSPDGFFPLSVEHGRIDEYLRGSGIPYTILQPTFYQDNVLNFQGQALRDDGAFYGSSGDGKSAYIASSDIASVAAHVLSNPRPHAGQSYVLTGPEAVSDEELAVLLSEIGGAPVRFIDVGDEALHGNLVATGMPDWYAQSMVGLENVKRNGWAEATTTTVRDLLGRDPISYRTFLETNRGRLVVKRAS